MPPKRKQTAEIDDRPKKKGKTKPPTFETGQVRRRQRRDVLIIDDVDELELQNVTDHIDREISKSQRNNKQLDTRKSLQSTKVRTKEHIPLLRNSTQSSISSKLDFISTCRDHYDRFNTLLHDFRRPGWPACRSYSRPHGKPPYLRPHRHYPP